MINIDADGLKWLLSNFIDNYLPNNRDNLKRILIKISYIVLAFVVVISSVYFSNYYYEMSVQQNIILNDREIFYKNSFEKAHELFYDANNDYQCWLKVNNTEIDYPVYKTNNNSFYLSHNGQKKKSDYGALSLDYRCNLNDKNIIIYGKSHESGKMFADLKKLRSVDFFKENSLVTLSTQKGNINYKIYAIFVLNASKKDDGNYIYNIYRDRFVYETDIVQWSDNAKKRSVITTETDVKMEDKILTLVTDCDDFENSRLVVMARSYREGEYITAFDSSAKVNSNPLYPKKWYSVRNITYPF